MDQTAGKSTCRDTTQERPGATGPCNGSRTYRRGSVSESPSGPHDKLICEEQRGADLSQPSSGGQPSETRLSRRAFPITDTDDRLMAAAAIMGDRSQPNIG